MTTCIDPWGPYAKWVNGDKTNLFFMAQSDEQGIHEELRKILAPLLHYKNLGRILIHAAVPRLLWSKSQVYRPVYFYFGEYSKLCEKCCQDHPFDWDSRTQGISPYSIISPYWTRKLHDAGLKTPHERDDGHYTIPKCWPRTFLRIPNLSPCPESIIPEDRRPKSGEWSALDILALARQRLCRWSIMKRDMVPTPGLSLGESEQHLSILTPKYYKSISGDSSKLDIVSLAVGARKALGTDGHFKHICKNNIAFRNCMQEYVRTFACDEWERAHVWKAYDSELYNRFSKNVYSTTETSALARDMWPDSKFWIDNELNRHAIFINTDSCALTTTTTLGKITAPHQGFFGIRRNQGHAFIYFDFEPKKGNASHRSFDKLKDEGGCLRDYCTDILLPWFVAFYDADQRWENRQTLDSIFPEPMQDALLQHKYLKKIPTRQRKLNAIDKILKGQDNWASGADTKITDHNQNAKYPKTFVERLDRARLLYIRRVLRQEDAPVHLALATMGDVWMEVFGRILDPHYPEYERVQQLLKGEPEYRDHLTHSMQVFLLGSRILDLLLDPDNIPDKEESTRMNEEATKRLSSRVKTILDVRNAINSPNDISALLDGNIGRTWRRNAIDMERNIFRFQWALTSLMHDYAIPVEKTEEMINHLLNNFVGPHLKAKAGGSMVKDALSTEESSYRALIYYFMSNTELGRGESGPHTLPMLTDFAYNALTKDHGFLSAIYLFNELFEKDPGGSGGPQWWRLKDPITKSVIQAAFAFMDDEKEVERLVSIPDFRAIAGALVLEVLDAIARHNAFFKEFRFSPRGDFLLRFPRIFAARFSMFKSPIPGLLMLCDTLSDWGRVVHPDQFRHHESSATSLAEEIEIVRPECQVNKIAITNSILTLSANYQWRLPYPSNFADNERCLQRVFSNLARDMAPYTPGFKVWTGCKDCTHPGKWDGDDNGGCQAINIWIKRFWENLAPLGGDRSDNLLAFPEPYDELFNKIQINIQYYKQTLLSGSIGDGLSVHKIRKKPI